MPRSRPASAGRKPMQLVQWPPPTQSDDDWPPLDSDSEPSAQAEPVVEAPKSEPPRPSAAMQCLQKVVDNSTDDEVRWMRARGCDLMPKRWRGVEPRNEPS